MEIEATVNTRPLTYMYDDVEGVSQSLTPAHLVYGRQIIKASSERQFEITSCLQGEQLKHQFKVLNGFT